MPMADAHGTAWVRVGAPELTPIRAFAALPDARTSVHARRRASLLRLQPASQVLPALAYG
jgi:hypothetical protein